MTAYSGTSEVGKVYRYYSCNQARKHKCNKKKISKEKIENFVVYKTMEFLQSDAIINRLSMLLFELQYKENTLLPRLDKQLADVEKQINNIITAIQKGVASDSLLERLNDLEKQKTELKESIQKEKALSPTFTKDEFKMALSNLRKIDTKTKPGKEKLIETFIGRIYLYDDHLKIIYNIDGEIEEITLEELESSNLTQCGQPNKKNRFLPVLFVLFAKRLKRDLN